MTVEIVILAMVAVFLGLRLYSVLGKRADHSGQPLQRRVDAPQGGLGAAPPVRVAAATSAAVAPAREALPLAVERGLRDILTVDRRFDADSFTEGARSAYRMILEAFWRGDRDELAHLCEGAVARSFIKAIDERNAAGEITDNRLVRINEAAIIAAAYRAPMAHITMRFVSDVAAVTRNAEGHAIAGSLTDAVEVRDVWSFTRDVTSSAPDWLLDETDEG